MSRIYVASSWRNNVQPSVVAAMRAAGHEVYDFKNPSVHDHGFHWSEVGMPSYDRATNSDVPVNEYLRGIIHPRAVEGFTSDFDAMAWADTCVLVLPCGRSAHLELGWFVGAGRRTAILLDGPEVTPELMYKMVDLLATDVTEILEWLDLGTPVFASHATTVPLTDMDKVSVDDPEDCQMCSIVSSEPCAYHHGESNGVAWMAQMMKAAADEPEIIAGALHRRAENERKRAMDTTDAVA